MSNYFLVRVKYDRTYDDGSIKKATEYYVVNAMSFTEAEARITKEMQPFVSGVFEVDAITRKRYNELIDSEPGEKWYECKVNYITLNEKGTEKKTPVLLLVNADNTRDAEVLTVEHLNDSMNDYVIERIAETKVLDVFRYSA